MDNIENNLEKIVDIFAEKYNKTLEGLASGEPINENEFFRNSDSNEE